MTRVFLDDVSHMSLWDAAHRWAEAHPDATDESQLPLPVKDILFRMMRAQLESRLKVAMADGYIFRDATFYPRWQEFQPFEDQHWDGSEEHRRALYYQATDQNLIEHDAHISGHEPILSEKKKPQRKYLSSVHVDRDNLAEWACHENLPFPKFWFSDEERQEIQAEYAKYKPYQDRIEAYIRQGTPITEEIEQICLQESNIEDPTSLPAEYTKTARVKENDIDYFWEFRMDDRQRARILCRHAAKYLWSKNKSRTIVDIAADALLQEICGAKHYSGKDTIRNWIKDLDPRDKESRVGRPSKT